MGNPGDLYQAIGVVDKVHDPVVADPDPVGIGPFELANPEGPRFILKGEEPPPDPPCDIQGEPV
jgi:hypothetical protein